jgi:hypothetical protein
MMNLLDLPKSETDGDYIVFFGNIMGRSSMVTIMRKAGDDINVGCGGNISCMMVAFIDKLDENSDPRFDWHDNVNVLDEKPFDPEWCVEQYMLHRTQSELKNHLSHIVIETIKDEDNVSTK